MRTEVLSHIASTAEDSSPSSQWTSSCHGPCRACELSRLLNTSRCHSAAAETIRPEKLAYAQAETFELWFLAAPASFPSDLPFVDRERWFETSWIKSCVPPLCLWLVFWVDLLPILCFLLIPKATLQWITWEHKALSVVWVQFTFFKKYDNGPIWVERKVGIQDICVFMHRLILVIKFYTAWILGKESFPKTSPVLLLFVLQNGAGRDWNWEFRIMGWNFHSAPLTSLYLISSHIKWSLNLSQISNEVAIKSRGDPGYKSALQKIKSNICKNFSLKKKERQSFCPRNSWSSWKEKSDHLKL